MKTHLVLALGSLAFVLAAGSLSARPALKDVAHVRDGLIATGIAYEISQECDSLSPRYFRAIGFLNGLKSHARDLGYSDGEIEAYIDDSNEKND